MARKMKSNAVIEIFMVRNNDALLSKKNSTFRMLDCGPHGEKPAEQIISVQRYVSTYAAMLN